MKKLLVALFMILSTVFVSGQTTHVFPATDTVNNFTNQNSFSWLQNSLYVGTGVYGTPQVAATAACLLSGNHSVVVPVGTAAGVNLVNTTGCSTVNIVDMRNVVPAYYAYTSPGVYTLQASGGSGITALTGDGTASGSGSVVFTLATVNSNVGSCGDSTHVGVATYDGKGRAIGCSPVSIAVGGSGTVTSVSRTGFPSYLGTLTIGSSTTTPVLTFVDPTYSQNFFLAGPTSGSGAPSARAIVPGDLPVATTSLFGAVKPDGSTIIISAGVISATASGSGTVTHTCGALTSTHIVTGNGSADVCANSTATLDGAGNGSFTSVSTAGVAGVGGGYKMTEGTLSSGVSGVDLLQADLALHRIVQNPNNAGTLILPGIATAGTAGHLVVLASNGLDLVDGGPVPGGGSSVGPLGTLQMAGTSGAFATTGIQNYEYNQTPRQPLAILLQALHNAKNQRVNILVGYDSFSIWDLTNYDSGPTVSTNRWPEQLRIQLQQEFGSGGTGMVPLVGFTSTSASSAINPEEWTVSGTFDNSTSSLGPTQSGPMAGTALIHLASGAVATFLNSRSIPYDSVNIYCMTNSGSGSLAISIDSGATTGTACGSSSGSPTAHVVTLAVGSGIGVHTLTLTSSGDSYLYAAEGTAGTTGVSIHNIAVGGALTTMFGLAPATQLAFSDLIPGGTQGVIMMGQTNDAANGLSTATFAAQYTAIVAHEQALASTPSVMIDIPPVDAVGNTVLAPYTAQQVILCQTLTIACNNVQDRWGTAYVSGSGLWDLTHISGGTHPNDKGHLDIYSNVYSQFVDPVPYGTTTSGCTNNCTFTGTTNLSTAVNINGGAGVNLPLVVTSSNTGNTGIVVANTSSGGKNWGQLSFGSGSGTGIYDFYDLTDGFAALGMEATSSNSYIRMGNASAYTFTNNVNSALGTRVAGMSLGAGNLINVGNGAVGDNTLGFILNRLNPGSAGTITIDGGTTNNIPLTVTSSQGGNTGILVANTSSGGKNWGFFSFGAAGGTGLASIFDLTDTNVVASFSASSSTAGAEILGSNEVYTWSNNSNSALGSPDTGLSRCTSTANCVAVGNGTAGDKSGTLFASQYSSIEGSPLSGASGTDSFYAASIDHRWHMLNGTTNVSVVGSTGNTPGNCAMYNSNGVDIVSSGSPCGGFNTSATATPGTGVTSVTCATATCTSLRGEYTVVGGTATTGTIFSLAWTSTPAAYVCTATMNGGVGFLGIGNSVATTTGMNVTAGVTVLGVTFNVNYSCQP